MATAKAVPECMNGHGPMSLATDQNGRPMPYEPGVDHATAFLGYECRVCSYREFLDGGGAPEPGDSP